MIKILKNILNKLFFAIPLIFTIFVIQAISLIIDFTLTGKEVKFFIKLIPFLSGIIIIIILYTLIYFRKKSKILNWIIILVMIPITFIASIYILLFMEGVIYNIFHKEIKVEIYKPAKNEIENLRMLSKELEELEKAVSDADKKFNGKIKDSINSFDYSDKKIIYEIEMISAINGIMIQYYSMAQEECSEDINEGYINIAGYKTYVKINLYEIKYKLMNNEEKEAYTQLIDLYYGMTRLMSMKAISLPESQLFLLTFDNLVNFIIDNNIHSHKEILYSHDNQKIIRDMIDKATDFEYVMQCRAMDDILKNKEWYFPLINIKRIKNERYKAIKFLAQSDYTYNLNKSKFERDRYEVLFVPINVFIEDMWEETDIKNIERYRNILNKIDIYFSN